MSEVVPEKWQCPRCLMSFQITKPPRQFERTRCAETGCNHLFWHSGHSRFHPFAAVGMDSMPEEVGL